MRLLPYTTFFPKPLVPIKEKPILDIILRQLVSYGFDDITISVGHLAELIEAYFEKSDIKKEAKLTYVKEDKPLGTAGSLSLVKDLDETVLVMNGDILTTIDYQKLVRFHRKSKSALTIASFSRSLQVDLGVMEIGKNMRLTNYIEKPVKNFDVSMGIYVYEPKAVSYIIPDKYLDFPTLVHRLLKAGEKVSAFPFKGYWRDIGRHDDYALAQEEYTKIKTKLFKG